MFKPALGKELCHFGDRLVFKTALGKELSHFSKGVCLCCSGKKKNLVIFGVMVVLSLHWENNLVIFFIYLFIYLFFLWGSGGG